MNAPSMTRIASAIKNELVAFDPDELLVRRKEGKIGEFLERKVHQPVSPIRGSFGQST